MNIEKKELAFDLKEVGEAGVFSGYGSIFGNVDQGRDLVMRGAFSDTLTDWRSRGKMPKMLWQHDPHNPIGVWTDMREDDVGLFVKGRLTLAVAKATEVYALLKDGAIDGLSIGYRVEDDDFDRDLAVRKIKRAKLYEVSVVTMAMNEAASVQDVKSAIDAVDSLSDAERLLREAGLSRKDSRDLVSRMKKIAQREAGDDRLSGLLDSIRAARAGLPQL